jgi:hypothetical protein
MWLCGMCDDDGDTGDVVWELWVNEYDEPRKVLRCQKPGCSGFGMPLVDKGRGSPMCVTVRPDGRMKMRQNFIEISRRVDQEYQEVQEHET